MVRSFYFIALVLFPLACGPKGVGSNDAGPKDVIWKFETTWEASVPIVYGNMLYTSAGNYLHALDAATGKEIWKHGEIYANHSNPVPHNQRVYVGSKASENYIYALDAATGEVIWQTQTGFPMSFVVVSEQMGMVYASSLVDMVCATDMETGQVAWKYSTPGLSYGMVLADGVLYVSRQPPSEGYRIDALDAATGQLLEDAAPPPEEEPVRFEDLIYDKSKEGGYLTAKDAETNEVRWQFKEEVSGGIYVEADGVLYMGAFNGTLYALEAKTGKLIEQYRAGSGYVAGFTISKGIAYVTYGYESIYAIQL